MTNRPSRSARRCKYVTSTCRSPKYPLCCKDSACARARKQEKCCLSPPSTERAPAFPSLVFFFFFFLESVVFSISSYITITTETLATWWETNVSPRGTLKPGHGTGVRRKCFYAHPVWDTIGAVVVVRCPSMVRLLFLPFPHPLHLKHCPRCSFYAIPAPEIYFCR